ncbi:hypothetical protein GCM10007901_27000 [Dyella acidisoli]|uniref:Uncharacterized protein n=1 Tax=Dyella acidisoli TaxID=1867834 RepID=A0ABQ5XPV9_9GAMM|nr:hypothetical protein GCM10007901_27000 [Dyella acidisoli]
MRGDFVGARCAAATYPTLMKKPQLVAPAKAGAQCLDVEAQSLGPGLRRDDDSKASSQDAQSERAHWIKQTRRQDLRRHAQP